MEKTEIKPSDRDAEIIELCKKILNVTPKNYYNPNGADESTCPFCYQEVYYMDADMKEITHTPDCAYLLAKDLSTNLI